MSWKDREYHNNEEGGASYPFTQWVNDGGQLNPRHDRGGFAMPEEQMEDLGTYPAGAEVRELVFRSGESTTVFFTEKVEVAVLGTRFCWLKDDTRVSSYAPGARSKLQALCLVRDADGRLSGPMMLTFRGIPAKHFSTAYKEHRARVRKATKGAAPAYAFTMTIAAGEPVLAGTHQKSRITPVILVDDFDPDRNYVGDDVMDAYDTPAFWTEVKAWREAWSIPGPNGEGEVGGESDEESGGVDQDMADLFFDDEPAPPRVDPLAQARAVKLPPTQKYGGNATVADLERANDVAAMQWFIAHGAKYPEVAHACSMVLEAMRQREAEKQEIPF